MIFVSRAQNVYQFHNKFYSCQFDKLYKQNKDESFSNHPKKIASSLKGYINKFSDDKDTLFIKFWYIIDTPYSKKPDRYKGNADTINSKDNNTTFAYVINWDNKRYFKVPFSANVLVAASIPFRYRLKSNADLEADFLNVGVNAFRIWGKTKFFKQEQIEPRLNYLGAGLFIAFSQQKIDSSNTNGNIKAEKQVAVISYGISGIKSFNGFSIILAVGCDNAIGKNAKYWEENNFKSGLKPWIGFGFGFKLTDISFKSTNSQSN